MYDDEPTYRDPLEAIEELLAIREHSPTFWETGAAELTTADPFEHPSWDVHEALTGEDGWDDPAEAARVLDQTVVEDARLVGLADTPTARPRVYAIDDVLADRYPTPSEELRTQLLALVPVDGSGLWPIADDYADRGAAA
ncbi:hypothetical protein ACIBFB_26520 [Nocardiopsis sp. NPDC050513]|uniref:hypothetical protein n=1 Tax=Nocardiopsis sp. NPDC050513 TaxID=3364338 RepID=UPI0037891D31